ncbi:MAG: 1-acyl-sn-glycerol-3-phosphate acyltransferase [Ferruginibacter sp.]|uniref:lysophospholipid acyltransferase family protein n=1 Tax=Ferruginibacter sp. TaxID=1940288 RepID=UPI0026596378|nr:lysophospholipid acyltransferase family protein [Ferruginibacter sp.]MDB5275386.1 1-acyl-sn-glycerol-3-phosphate acyltransferase [Ferruginibacter sp.]
MQYVKICFKAVFSVYGLLVFIAIMLLLFPFVVLASFFGKVKGGNIIYMLCQLWADIVFVLWGIRHTNYYEVPHDRSKQYVFVFNHVSYMDIPVLMMAIRGQHFRILGKAEMAKVPVFGFFYRNAVVMVDRSDAQKRAKSVMQLKSVIKKGISVVIAPEGTFNMTHHPLKSFYDGAFRVAIETQTPIKPILFLDTYDRMSYASVCSLTPGKSRAVYLEEVPVEGLTQKDVNSLKEKVYRLMEEKLIFYKAAWITRPAGTKSAEAGKQ